MSKDYHVVFGATVTREDENGTIYKSRFEPGVAGVTAQDLIELAMPALRAMMGGMKDPSVEDMEFLDIRPHGLRDYTVHLRRGGRGRSDPPDV